jgi:plasmid replication initiation protein
MIDKLNGIASESHLMSDIIDKINEIIDTLNSYEDKGILTKEDIRELRYRIFPESIIMR